VQAGGSEMEIYHILESHYLPQQPSLILAMIEQIYCEVRARITWETRKLHEMIEG